MAHTSKAQKIAESRGYLGGCKVCKNCGTAYAHRFRKCYECGGSLYRNETYGEMNARQNALEVERMEQAALLTELSGGAL